MVTCPDCGCQFSTSKQLEEALAAPPDRRVTVDITAITKLPRYPTPMGDMLFMSDILSRLELHPNG